MDANGSIGVIGAEPTKPYDRPPLSKALWNGQELDSIWRKTDGQNVCFFPGRAITDLDANNKQALDAKGTRYSWEKLLIATGGSPRRLPFGGDNIIYYRTLADYKLLHDLTKTCERFAVIGGGFIGSEVAAALSKNGKKVFMVFPGPSLASRILPKDLSQFVFRLYEDKGVKMFASAKVAGLDRRGQEFVVKTSTKQEIVVDGVVAGIGIEPNVRPAELAGLKVENGIVVDELLRTTNPDIYAAGDVANFYSPVLGKRMRVEHEDNANTMGKAAGRNMAGKAEPYNHLPMFYSDLFEFGYEAVGELDVNLEIFSDWKEPNKEGVIYYLQDGLIRGVLLWNVWGQVEKARELITSKARIKPEELKGRISQAAS